MTRFIYYSEMPRQKILHIITKGSPFGGAQKYVYTLATQLPSEQFESVVVVGTGNELPTQLEQKNIRCIQLTNLHRDISLQDELKSFWQLVKILHTEKPDIIHLNSPKAAGLSALAGRLTRVPKIVYTVHGWTFNERRKRFDIFLIKFFSWLTVFLCDTVIVIAKSEHHHALSLPFVSSKKIKLIYNGIEHVDFKDKETARQILSEKIVKKTNSPIDPDTLWIGTIAELHPNKNIQATINALQPLSTKYIFVIIGDGEERENLEQQIRMNNLSGKIFLIGKIDNASTYLKAFDIFTLPSLKEGLPYTLLEAGLAGLPCLSTYVGGIPEIVRNGVSGILVDPYAEDIRSGLEFLMSHPEKINLLGKALQEKVLSDFSLEKMIKKVVKVYMEK